MTPAQLERIKDRVLRGLSCAASEAYDPADYGENQEIIKLFEQGVIDVVQTQ